MPSQFPLKFFLTNSSCACRVYTSQKVKRRRWNSFIGEKRINFPFSLKIASICSSSNPRSAKVSVQSLIPSLIDLISILRFLSRLEIYYVIMTFHIFVRIQQPITIQASLETLIIETMYQFIRSQPCGPQQPLCINPRSPSFRAFLQSTVAQPSEEPVSPTRWE